MSLYLGLDTSNYTTSCAVYDDKTGKIDERRLLLDVKPGENGLRQSDAVFAHMRKLPEIIAPLLKSRRNKIAAVGVSSKPRDIKGSYMPCFEAGLSAAKLISSALEIPLYCFSHQAGHIVSALFSIDKMKLLNKKFIAFHVSGGTTEAVLCIPGKASPTTKIVAKSLDLKAGQAIDRVGAMLGLSFPAGPQLESLALGSSRDYSCRPSIKGVNCCLSGVENLCMDMLRKGEKPCDIARFCIDYIKLSLEKMLLLLQQEYHGLPVIFAGGVMSDKIIREYFENRYEVFFAKPDCSSDNAIGIAVLAKAEETSSDE